MKIQRTQSLEEGTLTAVFLTEQNQAATANGLPKGFPKPVAEHAEKDKITYHLTADGLGPQAVFYGLGQDAELETEDFRGAIHKAVSKANERKAGQLQLVFLASEGLQHTEYLAIALGETPELSNYQFKPYQKDAKPKPLETVKVYTDLTNAEDLIAYGKRTAEGTNHARDLVNEPPNVIYPETLSQRARELGEQTGFTVEVWDKAKIEEEGMGGLLAVNLGSELPPTFTIMTWKPDNATNSQPVVLVGKGVTFDTGGLSLKPSSSMVGMKGDMGGSAAVIGAMAGIAANNLPVHVVGLVAATDNRPGKTAYTPNDVIKMYDGSHVEVNNTDAEGRMTLADALHYAKRLNPALVIDLATLTGAAVIAVGSRATAMMATAEETTRKRLHEAGKHTFERLVELPLWDDYGEQLKSDIADLKNVGGREAGSITAGKFLQHFTDYPWIHLDIAGPAYLDKGGSSYRPKHGTGVGVRLLTEFIRRYS